MNPVTINITNLIGTMIIIGDKDQVPVELQEKVNEALLKVLTKAHSLENQELCPDKTSSQSKALENQD